MNAQDFHLAIKDTMDNSFKKSVQDVTTRLYRDGGSGSNPQIDGAINEFASKLRNIIDDKIKSIIERHKNIDDEAYVADFLKKLKEYNKSTIDPGSIKLRVHYKDVNVNPYGNPFPSQIFAYVKDIMADFIRRSHEAPEA